MKTFNMKDYFGRRICAVKRNKEENENLRGRTHE